jgi:hypothetical protein
MTDDEQENLRRLVNNSGFPFQLRVAQEVREAQAGCYIVAEEHPWIDPETGREGFIDTVVGQSTNHDLHRMVIESKRTRDADWVFLLPGRRERGPHVRALWTSTHPVNLHDPRTPRSGHHDFYIAPDSYISEFCAVRGTGEGQRPMLENLARAVLSSTESFAREEMALSAASNQTERRYYVPVIVTNARLSVCNFDVGSVSLETGEIPSGDVEEVPYIRFRKTLATRVTEGSTVRSITDANRNRHRTVLVVQSNALRQFLNEWYLPLERSANPLPAW